MAQPASPLRQLDSNRRSLLQPDAIRSAAAYGKTRSKTTTHTSPPATKCSAMPSGTPMVKVAHRARPWSSAQDNDRGSPLQGPRCRHTLQCYPFYWIRRTTPPELYLSGASRGFRVRTQRSPTIRDGQHDSPTNPTAGTRFAHPHHGFCSNHATCINHPAAQLFPQIRLV